MARYKISGVWKGANGVITHYAVHPVTPFGAITKASKISKTEVIALLEMQGNSAVVWQWSYDLARWVDGEDISVVRAGHLKYLRSNPDKQITDNLAHLIDFELLPIPPTRGILIK